eukprot:scaffold273_cov349-Prasinococcus_capsulatus_cf.AAC.5
MPPPHALSSMRAPIRGAQGDEVQQIQHAVSVGIPTAHGQLAQSIPPCIIPMPPMAHAPEQAARWDIGRHDAIALRLDYLLIHLYDIQNIPRTILGKTPQAQDRDTATKSHGGAHT